MTCPATKVRRPVKRGLRTIGLYFDPEPPTWLATQPGDIHQKCNGTVKVSICLSQASCCCDSAAVGIQYTCTKCKEQIHGGWLDMPSTTYDLETFIQKELDAR